MKSNGVTRAPPSWTGLSGVAVNGLRSKDGNVPKPTTEVVHFCIEMEE